MNAKEAVIITNIVLSSSKPLTSKSIEVIYPSLKNVSNTLSMLADQGKIGRVGKEGRYVLFGHPEDDQPELRKQKKIKNPKLLYEKMILINYSSDQATALYQALEDLASLGIKIEQAD